MNNIDFVKLKPDELDEKELIQIRGGIIAGVIMATLGSYMLFQIAGNPNASSNAFMSGWYYAY